uniref:Uncharacterized protein n=1 Tax=Vitis vinifera TaxID=29760 RepID=A5B071_VITVI|nr:hypothetical protein VITISV_025655 [Vitis vinifera]
MEVVDTSCSWCCHIVAKWMDTRSQPTKVLDSVVVPAKDIRTGYQSITFFFVRRFIYSARSTVPLINGEEIFYDCHDDIRRQHGHRHPTDDCQKPWQVMGRGPWLSEYTRCAMCALEEGPDESDPDDNACHVSLCVARVLRGRGPYRGKWLAQHVDLGPTWLFTITLSNSSINT